MTDKEKAKKYDEALKRARQALDKIQPENRGVIKLIKDAFPELKESEDERIRKDIIHYILYETKGTISEDTEHTWVKWLEKEKEQKPVPISCSHGNGTQAEWSEEDEDFINMLILHFNYLIDKGGDSVETYKSYIKKLKSLRPSWKPSEEQMNGLAHAINLDVYDAKRYGLDSLYNDLKKLM